MRRLNLIFSVLIWWIITSCAYGSNVILKDVSGQTISFSSLKGKWVLINYWASWCQPCLDEIAELNRFYKNKKDKVALFAVNYDRSPLSVQIALIKKYKIHYPSLRNNPARALKLGNIRGVPVTFVFNPEGKLSRTLYGGQTLKSLSNATSS